MLFGYFYYFYYRNHRYGIDEFQEFAYINSSIFSDIQNIWDSNKDDSKMNFNLLRFGLFNHEKNI